MNSSGFVKLFASPTTAVLIAAFIVAGLACLFFSIGHAKPAASAGRYWRRLSLVAQLCVALGLIGLVVFAGRMKLVADHQVLEERVRVAEAEVGERLRMTVLQVCAPVQRRLGAPYNPAVARKELCAIARTLTLTPTERQPTSADWEAGAKALRNFTGNYPGCVPNVFTRHSDCADTVAVATGLAGDIAKVTAAKQAAHGDAAMTAMVEAPDDARDWQGLLLAFLIAATGVSIKCARAASELFASSRSGGQ